MWPTDTEDKAFVCFLHKKTRSQFVHTQMTTVVCSIEILKFVPKNTLLYGI